jgi:hypothetical protein
VHCLLMVLTLCSALHDRPVLALTFAEMAAMTADGISTRNNVLKGAVELDPVSRVLIGRKPSWERMAPIGSIVAIGQMYLAERMKHSGNSFLRKVWWIPQVVSIGAHTSLAIGGSL